MEMEMPQHRPATRDCYENEGADLPQEIPQNDTHQHPFTLLQSNLSFTCDACGVKGDRAPYLCTECHFIVHKDCVSLPPSVTIVCHNHPLAHTYFLQDDEPRRRDCRICHGEVDTEYGSYYCSDCDYIVHVNCAKTDDFQGCLIRPKEGSDLFPHRLTDSIIRAIEAIQIGETSEAKSSSKMHFSHRHKLILTADNEVSVHGKRCDACLLSLSGSVYFCPKCDFFLHETCTELPPKKQHWAHKGSMALFAGGIFSCSACGFNCSGFGYICDGCNGCLCLRCFPIPDAFLHEGHKDTLIFHYKHKGSCSACGEKTRFAYRCKDCNLTLDFSCLTRPSTARDRRHDEHPLTLLYWDNDDLAQYRCQICEEERDPSHWFYSCKVCNDFKAHPQCVLGKFPFIKRGSTFRSEAHEHLLTCVDNYDYPPCDVCDELCQDLVLECSEPDCCYIVHWECSKDLQGANLRN